MPQRIVKLLPARLCLTHFVFLIAVSGANRCTNGPTAAPDEFMKQLDWISLGCGIILMSLVAWCLWRIRLALQEFVAQEEALSNWSAVLASPVPVPESPPDDSSWIASWKGQLTSRSPLGIVLWSAFENESPLEFLGHLDEAIRWPRYWAGLFVFIGLLGTVAGVALAVSGLGGSLGSGAKLTDLDALQTQIAGLLLHLRSSFYCTLGGLIATLVVSFFNARCLQKIASIEQKAARFSERLLLTKRERASLILQARRSREVEEQRLQVLQERQEATDLRQSLRDSVLHLSAVTSNLQQTLLPATDLVTQAAVQAKEMATNVAGIARSVETAAGQLQPMLQEVATHLNGVENATVHLEKTASAGNIQAQEAAHVLSDHAIGLKQSAEELALQRDAVTGIAAIVQQTAREMAQGHEEARREIAGGMAHLAEHVQTLADQGARHSESSVIAFRDAFEAKLDELLEQSQKHFERWQEELRESAEKQELRLVEARGELTQALKDTTLAWQWELGERMQLVVSELEASENLRRTQVEKSQEQLRLLAQGVASNGQSVLTQLRDEGVQELELHREALNTLSQSATHNNVELSALLRRFERVLTEVAAVAEAPHLRRDMNEMRQALLEVSALHGQARSEQEQRLQALLIFP